MARDRIIELHGGAVACAIAPALGGSVLRLTVEGRDVLRPAGDDADDVLAAASFPLVPFANRIERGELRIGEEVIQLPADPAAPPHAHHGHGWRAAWSVEQADERTATLTLDHPADAWPWHYRATQRFALLPDGLSIEIAVRNGSAEVMPVGVGIHPYFPRGVDSSLVATAEAMWENDAGGVARERRAGSPFRGEPVAVETLEGTDNFLEAPAPEVGIDGGGLHRTLAGDGAGFHVYVPAGEDFFCVEPVSHAPNSLGRGDYAEDDRLAPGEERRWTFTITARPG